MDSESQDHHRDHILPSFFPGYCLAGPGTAVHQPHHHQLSQQNEPQSRGMFQFTNPSSSPSRIAPENSQQMDVAQQYPQPQASLQSQTQINLDMLGDLLPMPMPCMDLNSSQDSTSNSTSQMVTGGGQLGYIPQAFIDHQFRVSQLHQLQQLQQHIFQQQIALLSGQASGLLNGAPTLDTQRNQSLIFNGIPTPAPSGELRPQQQSLDFIAPMALNSFGDSASQSHSSSLPNSPATLHSAPGSVMSSPAFLALNNGHPSSNTFSTTPYVRAGSVSAPEHIAFQNHGFPPSTDLDLDISPLTSPWLGAQPNQPVPPLSSQLQNRGHQRCTRQQPDHHSSASSSPAPSQGGHQYPSTPVTGPVPTSNNATNTNTNKRSASPSSTETDARKKQSPAIRPTNPGVFSAYLDQQPSTRRSNRTSTRSTSTSSTPLLRGRSASTRQRKGSTVATPIINEVPGDSPSPVDLSMPPPAPPVPPNSAMMGSSTGSTSSSLAVAPITPVTPASIMNLDMKGKRLKIATDTPTGISPTSPATSRSKRGAMQGNMTAAPSLISPSLKPILPGPTGNILAMTPASPANGSHPSPAMSASSILPPQVRKTSHKAAEQKRRDSLKTTFDDLRGLLPPIPLPSTPGTGNGYDEDGGANGAGAVASGTGGSGGSGSTGGNLFGTGVKPLLPGALPPRGPPKAGGEGPNKSVSKLQLLICGNEFIRTLKSRVDRRDEEIVLLRREVRNLRQLKQFLGVVAGIQAANPGFEGDAAGGGGGPARGGQEGGAGVDLGTMGVEGLLEELDLELDLDRDIDAVEKMGGLLNGALTGSGRRDDLLSSARSDITMDEDPVEDDED